MPPRLGTQRRPVERRDRAPQGDTDDLRTGQGRTRHRGENLRRETSPHPVRQSRVLVGLVHDDRHAAPRGEIRGQRHVTAETHDDVGTDPVQHLTGTPHRLHDPSRQSQQVHGGLARQRHRGHQFQRITAGGYELVLQPPFGSQRHHPGVGAQPHHRIGQRHRRLDMPRRPTTGDHDGRRRLEPLRRTVGLRTLHRVALRRLSTRRVRVAGPCLGHVRPSPVFPTRRTEHGASTSPDAMPTDRRAKP